jgi:hypothetical protein
VREELGAPASDAPMMDLKVFVIVLFIGAGVIGLIWGVTWGCGILWEKVRGRW